MSHKIDAALNHRASISERVQRLREQLLSARPEVFDERGLLITDAYREALNEPAQMRRAKALDRILRKAHIQIKPDELIVGCKVPQLKGSPVYPEFNVQWLEDELDTLARREKTPFYDALMMVADAAIAFAHRYAELARDLASRCDDGARRQELENISRICTRVPEHPAESLHEALQSFWFIHLILNLKSNYDLKAEDAAHHERLTGKPNLRIKKNLETILSSPVDVLVRMPLIPGLNDTPSALRAVGRFLEKAKPEVAFKVLGYHRLGIGKYEQLGRPYVLADMDAVSSEQLGQAKVLLREFNLTVV